MESLLVAFIILSPGTLSYLAALSQCSISFIDLGGHFYYDK